MRQKDLKYLAAGKIEQRQENQVPQCNKMTKKFWKKGENEELKMIVDVEPKKMFKLININKEMREIIKFTKETAEF